MTLQPMSAVDAAWYHMDGPANLAMVTGMLLTASPLDFHKVREVYRQRLASFDRFHQRVVERGVLTTSPHWEDMPGFDIDQHMHHIALPEPQDEDALKTLVNDLASTPLDRSQPLWQVHVVDGVQGGSALIMRYHHCMADGTAMMAVIQKLYDPAPGQPRSSATTAAKRGQQQARDLGVLTPALHAIDQAGQVLGGAAMLLAELLKPSDPQSPLKGEFGLRKHVAWSQPLPVRDVKAVGAAQGATVNDVLIAATTGALRHYLKQRGMDVNHMSVRAMVPVDLRPPERAGQLGNEFGLVILELPVASARPEQRLALVKARMGTLKHSPEPVAARLLLDIMGRVPKPLEDVANQLFGSKASVVMTNVVGPPEPLSLAGAPIDRMFFWVPHPGQEMGMGISIMSYRGMASLAVIADARLVPDPEAITQGFHEEFSDMKTAAKNHTAEKRH